MFPIKAESRISLQNVNINQIKEITESMAKAYLGMNVKKVNMYEIEKGELFLN